NSGVPPDTYPIGFDKRTDGAGHRWLEKNGFDSWDIGARGGSQSTSVAIFGGKSACMATAVPGVAAGVVIQPFVSGLPATRRQAAEAARRRPDLAPGVAVCDHAEAMR